MKAEIFAHTAQPQAEQVRAEPSSTGQANVSQANTSQTNASQTNTGRPGFGPTGAGQSHAELRASQRRDVEIDSFLARRTFLRVPGQSRQHKCRITDYSAAGYRAVILSPFPNAGQQFSIGQELDLEHIDGWHRAVSVRWVRGNMLGLKILNPVTRVILTSDAGEPEVHECNLLGTHGDLFRVNIADDPVLFGAFNLELPNGETFKVRVRWMLEGEVCLQPVRPYYRL